MDFTKLDTCIDIVEICLGIMGKFRQFLTKLSVCDMIMVGCYRFSFYFLLVFGGNLLDFPFTSLQLVLSAVWQS